MNPYVPYPNIHIPNPDSYLSMIYPIYKENQAKWLSYLPILDELFWKFAYYIQFFIS